MIRLVKPWIVNPGDILLIQSPRPDINQVAHEGEYVLALEHQNYRSLVEVLLPDGEIALLHLDRAKLVKD